MNAKTPQERIPHFDYERTHAPDLDELMRLYDEVTASGNFILKGRVQEFEQNVARLTGRAHAVATSSATMAMTLGLKALGVGPGDEVVTPAFSYTATAGVVPAIGARIVFCDVDEASFLVTPELILDALTERTRAVIVPHLFRRLADVPAIRGALKGRDVAILEDAATAIGGRFADGSAAGAAGDFGAVSFFPAKPLGGIGDGGMMLTDCEEVARRCRSLRNHGQDGITRFVHHEVGYNARMDEWNAAYLSYKAERLDSAIQARREAAALYEEALAGVPVAHQAETEHEGVPYAFVILVQDSRRTAALLGSRGIATKTYTSLDRHPAYASAAIGRSLEGAQAASERALALPFFPGITRGEVERVVSALSEFEPGSA
jgi:dTDP-4-amino-4,6-dideoxygalactose transaminase